jgi:thioredoxin reductase (NADPH)
VGVFAAGDIRKKPLRQVATAVGDGAMCAHSLGLYMQANSAKI